MSDYPPLIMGIDPGSSGGVALLDARRSAIGWPSDPQFAETHKMPATETDLCDLFREYAPYVQRGIIEAVHAMPPHMPGNTSVASFAFGKSYGFLRGVLIALRIPFIEVSPQKWKKAMGLNFTKENTATEKKNGSKQYAQQLFPSLEITHATAEALLLGEYLRRQA